MSNAKETPVPATTEQAAKEKGALTSNADYNTDSATLQEENSSRFSSTSGRHTRRRFYRG